jgi:molybdenum cofactor cytidylyltransferase
MNPPPSIDAIVLAAGRSRRMQRPKLLLPFAGQTVIGHLVDQVLAAAPRSVFVVVAAGDESLRDSLREKPVMIVENPDTEAEMLSSVRVGLRALACDAAAALIVLGDQPSLRCETMDRIVEPFCNTAKGIIVPTHAGKRGHPLLISARYFSEIMTQYDAVGLRGLLNAHSDDVLELSLSDAGVLADMDYPEDYERELANYSPR